MDPITILSLAVPVLGMIFPAAVDFLKKKFIPASNDTPERTMSTLATTKPETLGPYVESLAKYLDAQTKYFNRDVTGTISIWVSNLRACIRPLAVIGSFALLGLELWGKFQIDPVTRTGCLTVITNWIGSRIIE